MDIERFKRLSIPKTEAGKMTEVVRGVIKEVQTNKQKIQTKNWYCRGRHKNTENWPGYLYTKKEECL